MAVKSNNREKFLKLREAYPVFTYLGYDADYAPGGLRVTYRFDLAGKIEFAPSLYIPWRGYFNRENYHPELIDTFLFHIGMIELISYWKAACPPVIEIRGRTLLADQIEWWKELYFKGLGEFFYLNSIEVTRENFVTIRSGGGPEIKQMRLKMKDEVIIPVGGGKDSVVTLELLGDLSGSVPLILNPRPATLRTAEVKGFSSDSILEINRTLDPRLLELNDQGFLNGHTPFSALLAFITLLASAMSGKRWIALSNESSANESTIEGTHINHQYSKTLEFEHNFRRYVREWMTPDIDYFSFLRPLNELRIAEIFARYPDYFGVFRSCNAGSKTDSWCGRCPKCLFAWIILAPFIRHTTLINIFGNDLMEDEKLWPHLADLAGLSEEKPFECVGTMDEVNAALNLVLGHSDPLNLPVLLKRFSAGRTGGLLRRDFPVSEMTGYNRDHFLPPRFEQILSDALHAGTSEK